MLGRKVAPYVSPDGYVLCRLMVPKNNEKTPAAAELFFAALHGTYDYASKIQPVLSFEIVSINQFIQFYFYVPKYLREFVEGQLYAQYPTVEISVVDDYADQSLQNKNILGIDLRTVKDDVYPIKTFENFDVDPLSGITSILSQLDPEEELWIQVCVSPAGDEWQKRAINFVDAMRAGRDPNEPFWKSITKGVFGAAKNVATSPEAQIKQPTTAELSSPVQTALKGIEEKVTKLGFQTKIRVVSLSGDYYKSRQRINSVVGAFKQFNLGNMNGFIQGNEIEGESAIALYKSRALGDKPYVFNMEELASIYHLPGESVATPTMDWAGSKKGEPPQNLPLISQESTNEVSLIGKTSFRNKEELFGIKSRDRALHIYTIGKTGAGKSTLLGNMIIDDIFKGRGVAVVDPHGDLINDVIDYIPEERIKDVIYFSPADKDFPIGFNLLENVNPEYKNIVASGIVSVFKKIFGESWGPRLEYILRNVVLGLLDYPGATLLSILRVLADTKFRRGVIDKISDPVIKDFFLNEFERYDQKFRTEAVAPIQNKVGQFLSSSVIRNIVGQEHSTMDIRAAMDSSKILLIDLSIGKIGEDNSALLGAMMITKIQMAAMSRADLPRDQRTPFYLYVDEFQNFATDSFAIILSEARKYGLSLMLANQYIAQLPETVADAIFGNVGTIICFRVGAGDAESLQREFLPVFEAVDLANLNNYNIYVKMAIDGITSTPFSSKTVMSDHKKSGNTKQIIEYSRMTYSRPRDEVEKVISEMSASASLMADPVATKVDNTPASGPSPVKEELKPSIEKEEKNEVSEEPREQSRTVNPDLPEELGNDRPTEDYDTNIWHFLTRTNYRKLSGKSEPGEAEKGLVKEKEDKAVPKPEPDLKIEEKKRTSSK